MADGFAASAPSTLLRQGFGGSPSPMNGGGYLPITGYASLWSVADMSGDVVVRGAFAASIARRGPGGVRMLYQHGERSPVGLWTRIEEDGRGLRVEGQILDVTPEGRMAAAVVRAGCLDGLSIGFRAVRARRDGRLRVLAEVDLWEVSLVTFPMLPGARLDPSPGPR